MPLAHAKDLFEHLAMLLFKSVNQISLRVLVLVKIFLVNSLLLVMRRAS